MDNRQLSIVPTNDFTPGMEGSVHITLDGERVVPYVEEELAAELVRRYNAFPALVEALEGLRVCSIICRMNHRRKYHTTS